MGVPPPGDQRSLPVLDLDLSDGAGDLSRRDFLRIMGASIALAGIGGCFEPPRERIMPYTVRPPEVTPGVPSYYATTMMLGGYGTGLVVESWEGRPTKVEGNPDHPASLGAAGVYEQASVLQLYDPDRLRIPEHRDGGAGWVAFARDIGPAPGPAASDADRGRGLHFLLEPTTSPLTATLVSRIQTAYPAAGFTFYSALGSPASMEGSRLAFGRPLQTLYDFRNAAVIVALDSDFLDDGPFQLRYAREFADARRIRSPTEPMNRLYVAESGFSPTGGMADHRLAVRTAEIADVAMALLAEIMGAGAPLPVGNAIEQWRSVGGTDRFGTESDATAWVRSAARDLREQAGRGMVVVGEGQPAVVHALGHALNALLGNLGTTVRFIEPILLEAGDPLRSISDLAAAIDAGDVDKLVILGGNPAYTAPAELDFGERIRRVGKSAYLGLYENETARECDWRLPELHYLESWGDARAFDGTISFVQPLIRPLYDGRTVDEVLALFTGEGEVGAHGMLRAMWGRRLGFEGVGDGGVVGVSGVSGAGAQGAGTGGVAGVGGAGVVGGEMIDEFEAFWTRALGRGVIEGTAAPVVGAGFGWEGVLGAVGGVGRGRPEGIEITFRRDPKVYDGRFANNAWLQELPDPVTKLTWDNAAQVGPETAARLGVGSGDVVTLEAGGRRLSLPALIVPGHAEGSVSVSLGYGRTGRESVARGIGVNAYLLRTAAAPYFVEGAALRAGDADGERRVHELAITQGHWTMEGRPIALEATLDEYRADPGFTAELRGEPVTLHDPVDYTGVQWAMTIDLSICTGCSACVVACQAENNTPVVGKAGVMKSREMHWLRIDRYYTGPPEDLRVIHQPMLCQHCEKAPCEYVCPVNATVHSPDGLNEMVYNRCVGTRFCSNNCPYKVRRFNWFDYNAGLPEILWMQRNPDVTVRERGVMEKCTYCVQRLRREEIRAASEGRGLRGDEVMTACQQACPTRAIVFGSLGDPESEVSRAREEPRSYSVLHELGTEPRTRYLARITNPASSPSGV